jgi:hypothetical protein
MECTICKVICYRSRKNEPFKICRQVYLDKVFHPYNKNNYLLSIYFEQPYSSSSGGKSQGIPRHAEVAQGVPCRLRSRIITTFGTTKVVGCQSNVPAAFTPGEIPGTHFQRLNRPHRSIPGPFD